MNKQLNTTILTAGTAQQAVLIDADKLFEAAERTALWMTSNQVYDRLDANKGRSIYCYQQDAGGVTLTNSWPTGGMCMGLLAMYQRTGDSLYLDRAELAGRYIMSLQVMDAREDRYYGAIRECTPQSLEFCPRDATTAAWALVWLYKTTKRAEYLDRAQLYANWQINHGMYRGWPLWAVFMDGQVKDYYARGSFQSGTGLFYYDLFRVTGDAKYVERGLEPIATTYRNDFFHEDGEIIQQRDVFTNKITDRSPDTIENCIHKYNDDFGGAMLQAAADLLGDESYRETAYRFAKWLANHQADDGGFVNAGAEIHSAVPIALMYFHDLGRFYHDPQLILARDRTLEKLLTMQFASTGDNRLDGGFCGVADEAGDRANGPCVHMRTTMYALIALLKLEGKVNDFWLGSDNPKFTDPLSESHKHRFRLKW